MTDKLDENQIANRRSSISETKSQNQNGSSTASNGDTEGQVPVNWRTWLLIIIPPLLSLIGLIWILWFEANRTPAWQAELEQYLHEQRGIASPEELVQTVLTAQFPERFDEETPFQPVGYSDVYLVGDDPAAESGTEIPRLSLPYPPSELWCFQLTESDLFESENAPRYILVARHQSIESTDWIVHMPPSGTTSFRVDETLTQIGCEF